MYFVVFTFSGGDEQAKFGQSLSFGFIKSSTAPVLLVGSPSYTRNEVIQCGAAFLLPIKAGQSGDTVIFKNNVIHPMTSAVLFGLQPFARFGWRVAISDFDGDGHGDVAATAFLRLASVDVE